MKWLPLLALLLAAAPPDPHPGALVGNYDGGQMELAAGLQLRADGRFRYGLSYGALDEQAAGTWRAEGDAVLLTSEPKVKPPRFAVVKDEPVISGELFVILTDPKLAERLPIEVALLYSDHRGQIVAPEDDGRIRLPDSRAPIAIQPILSGLDADSATIALEGKIGHRITLRFEPNDIGKAAFDATPLAIVDGALLLDRHGRTLKFEKQ